MRNLKTEWTDGNQVVSIGRTKSERYIRLLSSANSIVYSTIGTAPTDYTAFYLLYPQGNKGNGVIRVCFSHNNSSARHRKVTPSLWQSEMLRSTSSFITYKRIFKGFKHTFISFEHTFKAYKLRSRAEHFTLWSLCWKFIVLGIDKKNAEMPQHLCIPL